MIQKIKQGIISGFQDIHQLHMIDWSRLNGYWDNNPAEAIEIATSWLTSNARYTIASIDLCRYPQRNDWPGWPHAGRSHERLGRLFWNSYMASGLGTLTFHDAPDFSGTITRKDGRIVSLYGDIGIVSASTFLFTLVHMHAGDLWVSVLDEHTQVILEPLIDFERICKEGMAKLYKIE
ncbi:MAG: hypothetical protein J2P37_19360 [Ktedonobacteraceae bacterium]|nr:hypothetical protein [Ktedonobacteraceae bacterium]